METILTPDQLSTPQVIADPYPAYHQLRDRSPFEYVEPPGAIPGIVEPIRTWAFLNYRDVYGALRDHDTFSSVRRSALRRWQLEHDIPVTIPSVVLLNDDPPRHTRFRRLVNHAF